MVATILEVEEETVPYSGLAKCPTPITSAKALVSNTNKRIGIGQRAWRIHCNYRDKAPINGKISRPLGRKLNVSRHISPKSIAACTNANDPASPILNGHDQIRACLRFVEVSITDAL